MFNAHIHDVINLVRLVFSLKSIFDAKDIDQEKKSSPLI